MRSNNNNFV